MRALTCFGTSVSTLTVLAASTLTLGAGAAAATGPVALSPDLRNCDFSRVTTGVQVPRTPLGSGVAVFHTSGSTVTAQVHVVITDRPGAHYDVGLIQAPHPASVPCGPGDPGTTYSVLDTDATGQATVSITAPVQQGTTGVWVRVTAPNEHNQAPAEYYTSDFVAPI